MHVLTMEGLMGAGVNAKLVDTPMRAAGAAERRGDTAAMERALGYAGAVADQAEDYQKKAAKGMEKEAEEAKKAEEKRQEELAEKRAEEKKALEERICAAASGELATAEPVDSLVLSEEGRRLSEDGVTPETVSPNGERVPLESAGAVSPEAVPAAGGTAFPEPGSSVYTAAGETVPAGRPEGVFSATA